MNKVLVYYRRYCNECGKGIGQDRASNVEKCAECQTKYRRQYRREWARKWRKAAKKKERVG